MECPSRIAMANILCRLLSSSTSHEGSGDNGEVLPENIEFYQDPQFTDKFIVKVMDHVAGNPVIPYYYVVDLTADWTTGDAVEEVVPTTWPPTVRK